MDTEETEVERAARISNMLRALGVLAFFLAALLGVAALIAWDAALFEKLRLAAAVSVVAGALLMTWGAQR